VKRPKIIMAGIGLAALATAGGITAVSASGSPAARATRVLNDVNGRSPRPAPTVPSRGYGY